MVRNLLQCAVFQLSTQHILTKLCMRKLCISLDCHAVSTLLATLRQKIRMYLYTMIRIELQITFYIKQGVADASLEAKGVFLQNLEYNRGGSDTFTLIPFASRRQTSGPLEDWTRSRIIITRSNRGHYCLQLYIN